MDIEKQSITSMRKVVERNVLQLKRMRNIAMFRLGLAACLVVTEFILARLTRLDMSRFLSRSPLKCKQPPPPTWNV